MSADEETDNNAPPPEAAPAAPPAPRRGTAAGAAPPHRDPQDDESDDAAEPVAPDARMEPEPEGQTEDAGASTVTADPQDARDSASDPLDFDAAEAEPEEADPLAFDETAEPETAPADAVAAAVPARPSRTESARQRLTALRGKMSPPDPRKLLRKTGATPAGSSGTTLPARLTNGETAPPPGTAAAASSAATRPLPASRAPAIASASPPAPARALPAPGGTATAAAGTPMLKRPLLRRGRKRMSSSRAALLSMTSQEAPLAEKPEERDLFELIEAGVMRIASLAWLAAAILIWGRLIGYGDGAPTMAWHSLGIHFVPTLVEALVAPIVSVGLWLVSSWGAVVWAAAVLVTLALAVAGILDPPFGILALVGNILALLLVGTLAGIRAWRDRDIDD